MYFCEKYRRGVKSHGLFLKWTDVFPERALPDESELGKNVSEELGVVKHADTADTGKSSAAAVNGKVPRVFSQLFPSTDQTDEPRIQSETTMYMLDDIKGKPYYITEKYDGCSTTVQYDAEEKALKVASRSQEVLDEKSHFYRAVKFHKLEEKLHRYPHLVFQFECYGPGIQSNHLEAKQVSLACFTIFDTVTFQRLNFKTMQEVLTELDIPMVHVLETGDSFNYTLEELQIKSQGLYLGTEQQREGIVIRPQVASRGGPYASEWLSFKMINDLFNPMASVKKNKAKRSHARP
jgi:hypothetical protein